MNCVPYWHPCYCNWLLWISACNFKASCRDWIYATRSMINITLRKWYLLKLTFALEEFTHSFDVSDKLVQDSVEGTLSKQAQQVLRKILLSTCNMSNQNAWSLSLKFELDLERRARQKGWPFIQSMSSDLKLDSGVRIQVILWGGGLVDWWELRKEKTGPYKYCENNTWWVKDTSNLTF